MKNILRYLPGFNCEACGYDRCDLFAEVLLKDVANLSDCIFISRDYFQKTEQNWKLYKGK